MHPAAKLLLALLPPPEKAVWHALFALALPFLLLALLFAGPAVIHERVPLATPGQARWYIDGAEAAGDATRTVCNPAGLRVDWRPLLAIDAVLLRQDFSRSSRDRAETLAHRFIEPAGATRCNCRTEKGGITCDTAPAYRVRALDEVLDGLARESAPAWRLDARGRAQVTDYLAFDLDALRDVGAGCAPPGWTPREANGWRWPLPGRFRVTSCFGPRLDPVEGIDGMHHGLDVAAEAGDPVAAARTGRVVHASRLGVCGNAVVIAHGGGLATRYCHLGRVAVARGEKVAAGEVIGYAGSTGRSTGPHLHFEVRRGGVAVEPIDLY